MIWFYYYVTKEIANGRNYIVSHLPKTIERIKGEVI